ncbi:hypothetical protein [Hyalangium gracile]|uniref:hypothetical protein n=1 Tax=Hyalangium gracile TaxID=394092 RepID=UPI001CD02782|nr:hypothetical protein [Hyalangium gracile]
MSDHLSALALDEVAVGGPRPPHLESCVACQGRLERLRTHADATRADPRFLRVRNQVRSEQARTKESRAPRWRLGWVVVPALAAAVAVLVVRRPTGEPWTIGDGPPGVRVKGQPAVELIRLADGAVNPVLSEGDQVELKLRGGGHRFALVVSVDGSGQPEQLWPGSGNTSGALSEAQTTPRFQVTEGDFVVHAFYSDRPLGLDEVRGWLPAPKQLPAGVTHTSVSLKVGTRR